MPRHPFSSLQGFADTFEVTGDAAFASTRRITRRMASLEATAILISIIRIISGR